MSGIRVSNLRGETAGSSPIFPDGVVVTGVTTSTSFSGNLTGNVTGNVTGNISGTTGSFSGNVSVGGTLSQEDVTNIDSVGVVTARGGIRIGVGQSVSSVSGIITYYGDGSQLTGLESGVHNFVASGNIDNGKTVVINTDGTVGIVTITTDTTPSAGTPVVFESAAVFWTAVAYIGNSKVVVAYSDGGNSYRGTAVVGTVSGTSISFGTPVTFNSVTTNYISAIYDSTNDKVVIAYTNQSDSNKGTCVVGTVSGTSISFGTPVTFDSNAINTTSAIYDSTNDKVVIAYSNGSDSNKGTCVVGTVSGTSISFGTPVVFDSSDLSFVSATYDSTNSKAVIAYRDTPDGYKGKAIVGTVSGTSISFGSVAVYESANQTTDVAATYDSTNQKVVIAYANNSKGKAVVGTVSGTSISFGTAVEFQDDTITQSSATYDSTNGKIVIAYRHNDSSNHGTAIIGTVSGTSISFGTAVVFNAAATDQISATYDSNIGKVVIAYGDEGNSTYKAGTAIVGTVSGTSISFGSEVVFENANTDYIRTAFDSANNQIVIVYDDNGNSSYGTAVVFSAVVQTTNLTSSNFLGFSDGAYTNGQTAKIQIAGSVDDAQTGLTTATKLFVQRDGTLSTTEGNPSVFAGTAVSGTKIIVLG